MSNTLIAFPDKTLTATSLTLGSWAAALPLTNLQNPLLSKVARSTDDTEASTKFQVDLGAQTECRVIALLNHNISLAGTVRVRGHAEIDFDVEELINGTFDTDTTWTKGAGWSISGGKAVAAAATSNIYQSLAVTVGRYYTVTFTISDYAGGSCYTQVGAAQGVIPRSANGTYTEIRQCTDASLAFFYVKGIVFTGKIDNVSVTSCDYDGSYEYVWPQTFTADDVTAHPNNWIFAIPEAVTARYWLVEIADTANAAGYVQLGRCWIGPVALEPVSNLVYGGSLGYESDDIITTSLGGVDWGDRRNQRRSSVFKFETITAAEKRTALIMQKTLGKVGELLWIFNKTATAEDMLLESFPAKIKQVSHITYPYFDNNELPMEVLEII